jgi:hypothetical protein
MLPVLLLLSSCATPLSLQAPLVANSTTVPATTALPVNANQENNAAPTTSLTNREVYVDGNRRYLAVETATDSFAAPRELLWPEMEWDEGSMTYIQERYHMNVNEPDYMIWNYQEFGRFYHDVQVRADLTFQTPQRDGMGGVMCRLQESGDELISFYLFTVNPNGSALIEHYHKANQDNYGYTVLASTDTIPGFRDQGDKHTLVVSCIGDRLTLNVNNVDVLDIRDSLLTGGMVGLKIMSGEQTPFAITWDDVAIVKYHERSAN